VVKEKRGTKLRFFLGEKMNTKNKTSNKASVIPECSYRESMFLDPRLKISGMTILLVVVLISSIALSGCDKASYPEAFVESSIKEICEKEYKIQGVEVKFAGRTIGVFLPLKKLFVTDLKQEVLSGNVGNLDSLFEPDPEAMDQLENVLFTISRVLLSSDKPIDFYILQATDVESTGLQLALTGYVADIRRVRLWDISRTEYRKRVLHELKFDRSVLWERPVRDLLTAAQTGVPYEELIDRHFSIAPTPANLSPLFYDFLTTLEHKDHLAIEIKEMRSRSYRDLQALVYVRLVENYEPRAVIPLTSYSYPSGTELEYLFVVGPSQKRFKISQVIPFYYLDENRQFQKISLPEELKLDQNVKSWPEHFEVEEIKLGEFLARQLNRRIQGVLLGDERIHNTVRHAQINFAYRSGDDGVSNPEEPNFALHFDFLTKSMEQVSQRTADDVVYDEDVLYLLNLIIREFAGLVRSYQFRDYDYLDLVWEAGGGASVLKLAQDRLDLFREKKLSIEALLEPPSRSLF